MHAAAAVLNVTSQFIDASLEPLAVGLVEYGGRTRAGELKQKLDATMTQLKATMSHFAITEAWKDLGAEDKGNYLVVTSTLRTVINIHDNPPPSLGPLEMAANVSASLIPSCGA